MQLKECATRRAEGAAEFEAHEQSGDGTQVAESLSDGLTTIRNLMYRRLHDDLEQVCGEDSMIMPVSDQRAENLTKIEIEIYQIAVSASHASEREYVSDVNWYTEWLCHLRLGDSASHDHVRKRLRKYQGVSAADRRLHFTDVLVKRLREASQAPLVLFRLYPLAARVATSIAFGDHFAASEVRNRQVDFQPAIAGCHECHGRPLENGDVCRMCGNPVWTYTWLTAVD